MKWPGKLDRASVMIAIGVYVLSAVFGWAAVGAMIVLWFGGRP